MSNPINDANAPVAKISDAMLEKHLPYIEEAGKRAADPLPAGSLQRPYFCPARTPSGATSPSRSGSDDRAHAEARQKHEMVMIVPIYEREMAGVYYKPRRDRRRRQLLGKYARTHPAHRRVLGEVLLQAGNLGYPVSRRATPRSASTSVMTGIFQGRATARPARRGNRLQSVGDGKGPLAILWKLEQPPMPWRTGTSWLQQSGRRRAPWKSAVLRLELLCRPARQLSSRKAARTESSSWPEMIST